MNGAPVVGSAVLFYNLYIRDEAVLLFALVKELLRGYFTYTPVGLLDHTHIHLFTWNEIAHMFDACKLKIEDIGYTLTNVSGEEKEMIGKLRETVECSDAFMFEAFQYVFKANKI